MQRVLIIDDHALVASILTGALSARGFEARATDVLNEDAVLRTFDSFRPHVVLLDLDLGHGRSGKSLVGPLTAAGANVVMLTGTSDPVLLAECMEAGAVGLLSKGGRVDDIIATIERVLGEGSAFSPSVRSKLQEALSRHRDDEAAAHDVFGSLTRREEEVLAALVAGRTARQIASDSFTSIGTVRGHIQSVLDKLGVHSQLAAVAKTQKANWRPTPARSQRGDGSS